MSCDKKKDSRVRRVVRRISGSTGALLVVLAALFASPAALAVDSGDIVVVSSKGEVHVTMNGADRKVRAGGVLELPATVRTGRDGSVELRQGATTVSVGPETLLEFPALEKRGAPIDRIVQPRGNAFYDIGKREGRKLRVETPYLVGVVKGTQFNVAAQEGSTTISLFEGLLEVRAADDSDVVSLKAGEVASLKRGDKSISVLKMDAGKAPTSSRPAAPATGSNGSTPSPAAPRATPAVDDDSSVRGPINVRTDVEINSDVRPGESQVGVVTAANISVADTVDASANAAVNVSPSAAEVVTSIGVDAGAATVDVGVGAAVDAAAGTVDVSTNATVDAGVVSTDLGAGTSVDLGAGTVDATVSTSVDAGPVTADVATDTAVDLGAGTVDTSLNVGAIAPAVDVAVGVDAAVDAAAGTIDVGLDVAGADIDVGVDTADTVDTVETVTETVTDTVTDTVDTAGGLLDTLTRWPGRK